MRLLVSVLLVCSSGFAATLFRVAAGPGGVDLQGNVWLPDAQFVSGGSTQAVAGVQSLPYTFLRFAPPNSPIRYSFQLQPGAISVTLFMIEPRFDQTAGKRILSISVNGVAAPLLTNLDLFLAAGALVQREYTFPVIVSTGSPLTISFLATVGNAVVSGIQIDGATQPATPIFLEGPESGLPAACNSSLTFYAAKDTGKLFWCAGGQWKALRDVALTTQPASVTATQALLAYTAPDSAACTVEVSESPTYSPLVHDLDAGLFTNAGQDDRYGPVSAGARTFVAGSRLPAWALDAAIYSRALQANTQHFYRLKCAAAVTTGTFTTANIPVGSTYNETAAADSTVAGGWLIPTLDGTRTQTIVDPLTGALLSPVSLPSDQVGGDSGSTGMTTYDGAAIRSCNPGLHIDGGGNSLNLCNLNDQVGWHSLYAIVPATGESRHLGLISLTPNVSVDDNLRAYNFYDPNFLEFPYIGAFAARAGSHAGAAQFGDYSFFLRTPLTALMHDFDANFNPAYFGCSPMWSTTGQRYVFLQCRRGGQDAYGWMGILDTTTKTIAAAWNTFTSQPTKFCGIHEFAMVPGQNLLEMNWHTLNFGNTDLGNAAIQTVTAGTASPGASSITVTGMPVSQAIGGDPVPAPAVTVGDMFRILSEGGTEFHVTSIGSNVWGFAPALNATVSPGTPVYMTCNALRSTDDNNTGITYWDFLADPHGTDATGTTIITDTTIAGGGHMDHGPLGRVAESGGGYTYTPRNGGTVLASLNTPPVMISSTAAYNGITIPGYGNLLTKHPSYQQTTNAPWFADSVAFAGGQDWYSAPIGAVRISGGLYRYFSASGYPLRRKLVFTQATSGGNSMRDISGPGSLIGDTPADNFKYCVAHKAGECRPGSSAGDIYFNRTFLGFTYCHGGDIPNAGYTDICITNMPAYSTTNMQFYLGTSSADSQSKSRNLTAGLTVPKVAKGSPLFKAIADGSYALFTVGVGSPIIAGVRNEIHTWKVKVPPLPEPDGVDRTAYIPVSVPVAAGPQTNVVVKFWYAETGYCTSRAEDCYATGSMVPSGDDPFFFPSDGAAGTLATLAGLPCSSGCTVKVPAISQHVLYYAVLFRDAENAILSTGPDTPVVVP